MYTVSDRFLQTIAESHTPVTQVVLFRTDGSVETIEHTSGSVAVDRGSQARRTCTVTCADTSLIPRTPTDKLAVYGATLRISRGVQYSDGSRELVPMGVFRVDVVAGDVDEGPVAISGKSLESVIAADKFTAPYRASGLAVGAIEALIQRSIPDAVVVSTATDAAIGARTFDSEEDPWGAINEIAATVGAEVYCDPDGIFRIAELPDLLEATPVWTIAAGEGGVYVATARGMNVDGVYNGVLARGENTETNAPPVSALVVDSNEGSPTYWDGPFGHRPMFHSSATLITEAQCTAAATLLLRSAQAPNASADITALPNPALQPGDVIRVVYPNGAKELHQVQALAVPLEVGGEFAIQTISAKEGT